MTSITRVAARFLSIGMLCLICISTVSSEVITPAVHAATSLTASTNNPYRAKLSAEYVSRTDQVVTNILARGSDLPQDKYITYLTSISNGVQTLGEKPVYASNPDVANVIKYLQYEIDNIKSQLSNGSLFMDELTKMVEASLANAGGTNSTTTTGNTTTAPVTNVATTPACSDGMQCSARGTCSFSGYQWDFVRVDNASTWVGKRVGGSTLATFSCVTPVTTTPPPAPVVTAPVVTAPVVTAPVVTAPVVVAKPPELGSWSAGKIRPDNRHDLLVDGNTTSFANVINIRAGDGSMISNCRDFAGMTSSSPNFFAKVCDMPYPAGVIKMPITIEPCVNDNCGKRQPFDLFVDSSTITADKTSVTPGEKVQISYNNLSNGNAVRCRWSWGQDDGVGGTLSNQIGDGSSWSGLLEFTPTKNSTFTLSCAFPGEAMMTTISTIPVTVR